MLSAVQGEGCGKWDVEFDCLWTRLLLFSLPQNVLLGEEDVCGRCQFGYRRVLLAFELRLSVSIAEDKAIGITHLNGHGHCMVVLQPYLARDKAASSIHRDVNTIFLVLQCDRDATCGGRKHAVWRLTRRRVHSIVKSLLLQRRGASIRWRWRTRR